MYSPESEGSLAAGEREKGLGARGACGWMKTFGPMGTRGGVGVDVPERVGVDAGEGAGRGACSGECACAVAVCACGLRS